MSQIWEDVEPVVKVVPWAQASVYVNKDGKPRIRVFFSEAFLNACGHPKSAKVQFGIDGDKALLRLTWCDGGPFKVGDLGRGGARIQNVPSKAPAPDGARDSEACEVTHKDKASAIMALPLEAWAAQLAQPAIARAKPVAPAAPPQSKTVLTEKIDAVDYLVKKGLRCKKSGDGYLVDGSMESKAGVLTIINRYRRAATLPDIRMTDFD